MAKNKSFSSFWDKLCNCVRKDVVVFCLFAQKLIYLITENAIFVKNKYFINHMEYYTYSPTLYISNSYEFVRTL